MFSVIMPVYNGAAFVEKAIRSVLTQTVADVELVIVNDGSTDDSDAVIRSIQDARIRYIPSEQNRGAEWARGTAVQAAKGTWIAMLDQDDELHPRKFEAHLEYAARHPAVELTYNPRYDLLCSGRGIWRMFRPPEQLGLEDIVLGFPISPSETISTPDVMRRTLNETTVAPFHGGEIVWYGRHWMSGVRFGFLEETLNYRRHHPGRRYGDIAGNCADYIRAQNAIFDDSRCPERIRALRPVAHAWANVTWCSHAFAQDEIELAQELLRQAVALNPALLEGSPAGLTQHFATFATTDDTRDHAALLRRLFRDLPAEAQSITGQLEWAIDHGDLVEGVLALIWGRAEEGRARLAAARRRGAKVDQAFLALAGHQLNHFQADSNDAAADEILRLLEFELRSFGSAAASAVKRLRGGLRFGRAFRCYRSGDYRNVPGNVIGAIAGDPAYSLNRGAWSMLVRSLVKQSAQART